MSVRLEIDGSVVQAEPRRSLFDHAGHLGLALPTSCSQQGRCRECLVEVLEGAELLSPRGDAEGFLEGPFRLACCTTVTADAGLVRCRRLRRGELAVADAAVGTVDGPLDPAVACDAGPCHGVAADVGTTTVVVRLVDLRSGRVRASSCFENPQRFGGSDVVARIAYDAAHPGHLLQQTLLGWLAHAIDDFGCDRERIFEIVVTGNTTMRDLLFGLDVAPIGQRPFRSVTENRPSTVVTASAADLGLPARAGAVVYGMPLLRGHVGADAAACALAVDLLREHRTVCLLDIGTNTEVILRHRGRTFVASCPAGPAFEGGRVACGMPALPGAVETVRIDDATGELVLGVIGGGPPLGICGSGLVDILAELLRTGRLTPHGRFTGGTTQLDLEPAGRVRLDEADIAELAQAKAAHVAGLCIVLARCGLEFDDLERLHVAGAFGRRIDVAAAQRIGLLPALPVERIAQLGNAAIEGATQVLRSATRRAELEEFARDVVHVELETDPRFFDRFAAGCRFAPVRAVEEAS